MAIQKTHALTSETEIKHIPNKAQNTLIDGIKLINKDYLAQISEWQIRPPSYQLSLNSDVRIFRVERVVLENKQSVLESMAAAYTALGAAGFSVFLFLDSDGKQTLLYLGVRGESNKHQGNTAGNLLEETMKGHFAGSLLKKLKAEQAEELLKKFDSEKNIQAVTAVSGIPSLSLDEREYFMQGLEHFIDAAENHCYQALILAEPVSTQQLSVIRAGYESVATQISPLLKQQISFGENQSDAVSLSISENISQSLGHSLTLTETNGISETKNQTFTFGTNESTSKKDTLGKAVTGTTALAGSVLGILGMTGILTPIGLLGAGSIINGLGGVAAGFSKTQTKGTSESQSISEGTTTSTSTSNARGKTETYTNSQGTTQGNTQTIGNSRQINLELIDKHIEQWLKRIDQNLERLDDAHRYGGWQSAAYFAGKNAASTEALASIFLGLMRGQGSNSESFALTTWSMQDSEKLKDILNWLKNLSHPRLEPNSFSEIKLDYCTPSTLVSSKEMAIQLSLPRRSTSAVPVIQTEPFGRKIQTLDKLNNEIDNQIDLGKICHLWSDTEHTVKLNINDLASHVFITGSTGAGKSNTVYQILTELRKKEIPFLVIEPAKGEYKHIFGHQKDVRVLSTNPNYTELLQINPFKFPQGTHVFEHIDRLVEIFNVCWPMYAAMPAVLKEAILLAYERIGWDLNTSINKYSSDLFPNFNDLLETLEEVVKSSAYSEEVKSNYIGSLVTRVRSLTNGINGQLFNSNELGDDILFNQNVIVDLSRVGSQETKSLIMGILVLRLNEYRMATEKMNAPLSHVTVLEEAHNLLKKTSVEQSMEGANVAGKSVEMLSNAIAEMRTYGEGFIIADQSPNAVDISAIRNTNTKIIMRLPDEIDRRLVGRAAALNDEQVNELAKLPKGIAVVYQNNWLEAVLCKVNHCNVEEKLFSYQQSSSKKINSSLFKLHLSRFLLEDLLVEQFNFKEKVDFDILKEGLSSLSLSEYNKKLILDNINKQKLTFINTQEKYHLFLNIIGLDLKYNQLINNNISNELIIKSLENTIIDELDSPSDALRKTIIAIYLLHHNRISDLKEICDGQPYL